MDPDPEPEGNFTHSAIFKTTVLTVALSSLYFYKTGQEGKMKYAPGIRDSIVTTAIKDTAPARKKKFIYLTFDDGPNKGTRNVLNILKQERVKASLFVIGGHVYGSKAQRSVYDSAARETLFEIANHSFTHAHNKYKNFYQLPGTVVKDFNRCKDSLHLKSNIVRTPGRNIWMTSALRSIDIKTSINAADSLYLGGFKALGWDLEWHFDNEQRLVQTSEEMATEVDSAFSKQYTKTPGHLVLLAHDQAFVHSDDSSSLHKFILLLKKNEGYEFEQVSKYPGL